MYKGEIPDRSETWNQVYGTMSLDH